MKLIFKVRLYLEGRHYFAVLVTPDMMCSSSGLSMGEALINLGHAIAEEPLPQLADLHLFPQQRESVLRAVVPTPAPRAFPKHIPLAKRLLNDRFGAITLRQLVHELGLENVSPQLLSSSISGKGAKRVRRAIATALGEEPSVLWPLARS